MTLWISNGAVLKSSSQWPLKEFWKLNNSGPGLYNFQNSFYCHWLELLRTEEKMFKELWKDKWRDGHQTITNHNPHLSTSCTGELKRALTLSQTSNFRLFQFQRVCNFKCNENGRKFSRWVENTVGKGEIARYEQFLLYPQCFQKTYTACRHVKTKACLGKG